MSLKEIFLCHSKIQKCYKYFCTSIGRYILSADVIFFESKLEIFTSPSFFVSNDDYDYMFYWETLLNNGDSTFECHW